MLTIPPLYYSIYIILFVIGLVFPPNNWDSMTYHLPRIMHWMQNGSLDFYQTAIDRQLFTPPLAEYKILHSMMLMGSDIFASSVQYVAMCMIIPSVSAIVNFLVHDKEQQKKALCLTIALVPSISMIIFQATTTQTDLVASCFAIILLYALARPLATGMLRIKDMAFMCLVASMCYFVKPTSLIFVFFCAGICGVIFLKQFGARTLLVIPIFALTTILIAGPYFYRMETGFGSLLGNMASKNLNSQITPGIAVSNFVKNISMHLVCPDKNWNKGVEWVVNGIHRVLHLPINKGAIYGKYKLSYFESEDTVGNFVYLILLVFALVVARKLAHRKIVFIYAIALLASYLLFSAISPWQPWQTRLDLSFFVLTLPLVVYVFTACKLDFAFSIGEHRQVVKMTTLVLLLYCSQFIHLTCNERKNLALLRKVVVEGRSTGYLCETGVHKGGKQAAAIIKSHDWHNIGLCFGGDSYEYPFWVMADALKRGYNMQYLGTDHTIKGFSRVEDADVWVGDVQPVGRVPYAGCDKDNVIKVWVRP